MKVYGISYCELLVSGFSASPRNWNVFRASVCVSLTVIDCSLRQKEEKGGERLTWPVTRIVNHAALYFPTYDGRVPEVKIHRWDLSLRTPRDNIARRLLHSLRHSYIPIVNDNTILRRCTSQLFSLSLN